MAHAAGSADTAAAGAARLEAGDHLDQPTFHRRYARTSEKLRAELVGGTVIMPSPVSYEHSSMHSRVGLWLGVYAAGTPGVHPATEATVILGDASEPQPDALLRIDAPCGGRTRVRDDGYLAGPPELIVEIAGSSEAYDLYEKRRDYERAGVEEYLVVTVRDRRLRWFVLQDGTYRELAPDEAGVYRSRRFPGLWLDGPALLDARPDRLLATLHLGLAEPAHAAFVETLRTQK